MRRFNIWPLLGFFLFFLLYFYKLPIKCQLPSDGDTWLYLALFHNYGNYLLSFAGTTATTSLFPEHAAFLFGEPSFGSGLLFLLFNLITQNDVVSYYLFLSLVFALNAVAVYCLAKEYQVGISGALLAGLIFSCGPFMFGNIDNQNNIAFFPGIFSIVFFIRFISNKTEMWILPALFWAVQIYFSGYLFLFTAIILLLIYFSRFQWQIPVKCDTVIRGAYFFIFTFFLILPYLWLYFFRPGFYGTIDIVKYLNIYPQLSLHIADLLTPVFGTVFYHIYTYREIPHQLKALSIHALFPGITVTVLAILGVTFLKSKRYKELLLMLVTGLIIAVGENFVASGKTIHTPFFYMDQIFRYSTWFRVPIRAYIISSLAISILSAIAFDNLYKHVNSKFKWVSLLIPLLIILETLPMPFVGCDFSAFMRIGSELKIQLAKQQPGNVLQLPSSVFSGNDTAPLMVGSMGLLSNKNEIQREYLYMYYQSLFNRNCINGLNGFIPVSRINDDKSINCGNNIEQLLFLMQKLNIKYIVFHKSLVMKESELCRLNILRNSKKLAVISETADFTIFAY